MLNGYLPMLILERHLACMNFMGPVANFRSVSSVPRLHSDLANSKVLSIKWLDIAEVTVGESNNEICNVECKLLECCIHIRNSWKEKKADLILFEKETHLRKARWY